MFLLARRDPSRSEIAGAVRGRKEWHRATELAEVAPSVSKAFPAELKIYLV